MEELDLNEAIHALAMQNLVLMEILKKIAEENPKFEGSLRKAIEEVKPSVELIAKNKEETYSRLMNEFLEVLEA
jgi:hypothetical protein